MSNGYRGCGSANAEFEAEGEVRKGQIIVTDDWTSESSFVQLYFRPNDGDGDGFRAFVDKDNGDAVELVVCMLEAIDKADMATALRADSHKLEQRAKVRRLAEGEFRRATGKAEKKFLDGVTPQREAYAAEIAAAEKAYEDATGERMGVSGLIHVLDQKRF